MSTRRSHPSDLVGSQQGVSESGNAWRLIIHQSRQQAPANAKKWSRYETLSFLMLFWMFGIMMAMLLSLHLMNYRLATKTSSTSGTHRTFYGLHGAEKESPKAAPAGPEADSPKQKESHE